MRAILMLASAGALLLAGCEKPDQQTAAEPSAQIAAAPVAPPPAAEPANSPEPEFLSVGSTWTFGVGGRGFSHLGPSWSGAEPWGTWSIQPQSQATLKLDPAVANKALDFDFAAQGYVAPGAPQQLVDVLVGGRKLAMWKFALPDQLSGARQLHVPAALNKTPGELVVTFRFSNPASPKSLGQSADDRLLAMGVQSVALVKAADESPAPIAAKTPASTSKPIAPATPAP